MTRNMAEHSREFFGREKAVVGRRAQAPRRHPGCALARPSHRESLAQRVAFRLSKQTEADKN